jgi:hypothetical protein
MRPLVVLGLVSLVGCTPTVSTADDNTDSITAKVELSTGETHTCKTEPDCPADMVCAPSMIGNSPLELEWQCHPPPLNPGVTLCDDYGDCVGPNGENQDFLCYPITVYEGKQIGLCVAQQRHARNNDYGTLCLDNVVCASMNCGDVGSFQMCM